MGFLDRYTHDRGSRFIWAGLVLACLAVFLLARGGQDRELGRQIEGAFARTEIYAAEIFGAGLQTKGYSPVVGYTGKELAVAMRGEIFTDPTAARVRLFDESGALVYDSNVLTDAGLTQADNPNVDRAQRGETHALIVQQPFTWSTIGASGVQTSLLQVYTPLLLSDRVGASGVVEVDFAMEELRAVSKGVWPIVQLVFGLLFLLSLAMTVLSLQVQVAVAGGSDAEARAAAAPPAAPERTEPAHAHAEVAPAIEGGLTDAEVQDLRARLAKAAARKKPVTSSGE